MSKIEVKLAEIKAKFPECETLGVQCDFAKLDSISDYRELVEKNLANIDVGFLCLNAGLAKFGCIGVITDDRLEDTWRVNILHPIYLLQALASQLMKRDQRCGVLFTSSLAASGVFSGMASYSATKRAISCFGEAMHWELKENVDVTVWEPAYTESNIHIEKPPAMFTLPTKTAVRDVFNKFGERKTRGSLRFGFTPTIHGRPELGDW